LVAPFPLHPLGRAVKLLGRKLHKDFLGAHWPYRLDGVELIERRCGARLVLPRNLLGEGLQILGRAGCYEQGGFFAMTGQRDIGRYAAPMLAMGGDVWSENRAALRWGRLLIG